MISTDIPIPGAHIGHRSCLSQVIRTPRTEIAVALSHGVVPHGLFVPRRNVRFVRQRGCSFLPRLPPSTIIVNIVTWLSLNGEKVDSRLYFRLHLSSLRVSRRRESLEPWPVVDGMFLCTLITNKSTATMLFVYFENLSRCACSIWIIIWNDTN